MEMVTSQAVTLWMLFAAVIGIITYTLFRQGKIKASTAFFLPVLCFFLSFVLSITIIERVSRKEIQYNLTLFWTIKAILAGRKYLIWEIFWNIILFLPIGFMTAALLRKHPGVSILIGLLLSACIEIVQLLTRRGMFELDDIVYNSVGALIGFLFYLCVTKKDWKPKRQKKEGDYE